MASKAHKTEHSGAKHGKGAYYGRKQDAKQESNKQRRRAGREVVQEEGDNRCLSRMMADLILV
jgi:hypothetical protein